MEKLFLEFIEELKVGELQKHEGLGIYPLYHSQENKVEYLTLSEALGNDSLIVSEINSGGSVPELRVVNRSVLPVLVLDGEELEGAKQNRVINTTILIKESGETIIPVSCTESGRWSYKSDNFKDSGEIMPREVRYKKSLSVSDSLDNKKGFKSNQGEVWSSIENIQFKTRTSSQTNAMKDSFISMSEKIKAYEDRFKCMDQQKGMLVSIGGKIAGLDFVSSEDAFRRLQGKLVRSYAMDAITTGKSNQPNEMKSHEEFLKAVTGSMAKKYQSVGHGWDWRFTGKNIVGSSLLHEDTVIHAAFFNIDDNEDKKQNDTMRGFRSRSNYRRNSDI